MPRSRRQRRLRRMKRHRRQRAVQVKVQRFIARLQGRSFAPPQPTRFEQLKFGNIPIVSSPYVPRETVLLLSRSQLDAYNKLLNADLFSQEPAP